MEDMMAEKTCSKCRWYKSDTNWMASTTDHGTCKEPAAKNAKVKYDSSCSKWLSK